MEKTQAHEHLQQVAEIVRTADRRLHFNPWIFIIWGSYAFLITLVQQLVLMGFSVPAGGIAQPLLAPLAIAATVYLGMRKSAGQAPRETLIDAHAGIVFMVVLATLLVVNILVVNLAPEPGTTGSGMAMWWGFGLAMALLIVGLEASRPLLMGGLVLLSLSVIAAWIPEWRLGLLAVGWLAGLILPGLWLLLRRNDG